MSADIEVRLVDVVKKFGDAVAVDHIDLEVRDGEFFSLLGPSGCGKTTLMRIVATSQPLFLSRVTSIGASWRSLAAAALPLTSRNAGARPSIPFRISEP